MNMLKSNMIRIIIMALFSLTLWGCAGNLPEAERMNVLNDNWGKSYETAKKGQILNPDAGESLEPVLGLDGEAAEYGVNKYKESFEEVVEVETTSTFNINQ